jgi:hypothetical protein
MKNENTGKAKRELRVELKYCEGCGGLGVRECGGGQVYCDSCTRTMEELAVGRRSSGRTPLGQTLLDQTSLHPTLSRGTLSRGPILPVGNRSRLDDAGVNNGRDFNETESDGADLDESDFDDFDSDDFDSDDFDANDVNAMTRTAAGGAA